MTLHVQLMTMAAMVSGGIYLGFALDTYRRLTRRLMKWTVLLYLLEILFWLTQTILLFVVLYNVNNGELRFYVFIACLLGYSIYQVLCKQLYQKMLETVIHIIQTIFHWILHALDVLLVQPVVWLIQLIFNLLRGIWRLCWKLILLPLKWLVFLGEKILPEKLSENISKSYQFCSTIISKLLKKVQSTIKKWG